MTDLFGKALLDYQYDNYTDDLYTETNISEEDILPIPYLFRSYSEMPPLEQLALSNVSGKVLDVGCGAGSISLHLQESGLDVMAIDTSGGAIEVCNLRGLKNTKEIDLLQLKDQKFDTILLLMNGIGIAKKKSNLLSFLKNAGEKLNKGGQIICDSSDVKYLYEDEDGSYWMDLNAEYYGNFKFQMHYKKISGPEFPWLYVDYDTLHDIASQAGFKCQRVFDLDAHFLAQLTKI